MNNDQEKNCKVEEPECATNFTIPACVFAGGKICGNCGWYYAGECKRHGGYVDYDKYACDSFA